MVRTKKMGAPPSLQKLAVDTSELQSMLGCGRSSAVKIGEAASAKVQIGRRVLWNVERVKNYLNNASA